MRRPRPEVHWPESWSKSYRFDREEIYGEVINPGYVYAYENRRRRTLALLADVLEPGARIIDIAAAQGNFTLTLAEMGYRVTWNDLREELADYVRLKYERGEVEYAAGNAFDLEFREPFDAAVVTEIIEHVAHPDEFLRRTAALVRPGGWIIMTTPNGAFFRNRLPRFSDFPDPAVFEAVQFQPDGDGHIFLLHPDEIRRLAIQAGLELDSLEVFTNPLTNGYMKSHYLLRVLPRALILAVETASTRLPRPVRERLMIQTAARLRRPG